MQFDIGLVGLGLLALMSLGFGLAAQFLIGKSATRWLWLVGAVGYLAGGLVASEVIWGKLTAQEIQPIIDGRAFDEAFLGGFAVAGLAIIVVWYVTRDREVERPIGS